MKTLFLFLTCAATTAFAATKEAAPGTQRPNVLFIAIDDLRPELGCYGAPVKTPNIDKLASSAVLFNRAYCQVAVCGASRATLMTGVLPTAKRFTVAATHVDDDTPGAVTLPQVFKEAGYTTLSNGKIFHFPEDTGARSWSEPAWHSEISHSANLDPITVSKKSKSKAGRGRIYESPDVPDNAYNDGKTAEKTLADLRRLKEAGKPFFLGCGFIRPHMPFYAPKKYWDLYKREEIAIAPNRSKPEAAPKGLKGSAEYRSYGFGDYKDNTDDFHRMMRHGYYACTSYTDQLVGDVLNELQRLGMADNTIVVLWGDHGWNLGEHNFWGKHNTLNTSVRVPLIIKVPGKTAGQKSDSLVGVYDIFPTLCALAKLPVPASAQGRSFVPVLENPKLPFRDVVYARFKDGDAVVTDHLIYTSYGPDGEMLYDLAKDPQENKNMAGNPERKPDLVKMRQLLKDNEAIAAQAKVAPPEKHKRSGNDSAVE
jgi:iduronate 2-sulfatase